MPDKWTKEELEQAKAEAAEMYKYFQPDKCANCGFPREEHHYNGACYGVCGEFINQQQADR
jgi:hypothetical protein